MNNIEYLKIPKKLEYQRLQRFFNSFFYHFTHYYSFPLLYIWKIFLADILFIFELNFSQNLIVLTSKNEILFIRLLVLPILKSVLPGIAWVIRFDWAVWSVGRLRVKFFLNETESYLYLYLFLNDFFCENDFL
jgi:hypothetical protein